MPDRDSEHTHLQESAASSGAVRSNRTQTALIARTEFGGFEGMVETGSFVRIALSTGRTARIVQRVEDQNLDAFWRAGTVIVAPPQTRMETANSPVSMLGLALDLDRHDALATGGAVDRDVLMRAAGRLHDDPLMASVLRAMWWEADVHGASTAFFEHGAALVMRRLSELDVSPAEPTGSLDAARFARIVDLIESRLSDDLSVGEMAAEIGMDPSGFTRAFRVTTGTTPYAYLSERRMERAKLLLRAGKTVTRVAGAVGYSNSSKFAATFAKLCGMPPSRWRKLG